MKVPTTPALPQPSLGQVYRPTDKTNKEYLDIQVRPKWLEQPFMD